MSTKTVFILGAGASIPYGFPSGQELVKSIIKSLYTIRSQSGDVFNHPLPRILLGVYPAQFIIEFRDDLKGSQSLSIDAFLNSRKKYRDIGKMCIAYHLLQKEAECLKDDKLTGDWYQHFWSKIYPFDPGRYSFSFYTFNYDRSLRYFLHGASQKMSETSEKHIKTLKSIPIYHLHGDLGMANFGEIEAASTFSGLRNISENLKIIFEVDDMTVFKQLQEEMKYAENIVFLGFGYHPDNMKRMGFPRLKFFPSHHFPNIYASAYGLTKVEVQSDLLNDLGILYNVNLRRPSELISDQLVRTGFITHGNLDFLREHFPFEKLFVG